MVTVLLSGVDATTWVGVGVGVGVGCAGDEEEHPVEHIKRMRSRNNIKNLFCISLSRE